MSGILQKIGIVKPKYEDEDKILHKEEDIIASIINPRKYVMKIDIVSGDDIRKISEAIYDKEPIFIIDLSQLSESDKASFASKLKTVLTATSAQTKYNAFYLSNCPDVVIAVPEEYVVEKG